MPVVTLSRSLATISQTPTVTILSRMNNSISGRPILLYATVTAAGGTLPLELSHHEWQYTLGSAAISNGVASLNIFQPERRKQLRNTVYRATPKQCGQQVAADCYTVPATPTRNDGLFQPKFHWLPSAAVSSRRQSRTVLISSTGLVTFSETPFAIGVGALDAQSCNNLDSPRCQRALTHSPPVTPRTLDIPSGSVSFVQEVQATRGTRTS